MKIEGIITNPVDKVKTPSSKGTTQRESKETSKASFDIKDRYVPAGASSQAGTYTRPVEAKAGSADIQALKEDSDRAYGQLREIVRQMLERQGLTFQDVKNRGQGVRIDAQARAEAQSMIEGDGEYSVETVSDRIVDFAKAISGGDKSKIETLRKAIDRGFEAAAKAFGGELPEISQTTHDRINEKLDAWLQEE